MTRWGDEIRNGGKMNSEIPLYNSRIIKIYLEYLAEYYPGVDVYSILEYAGITHYEVEDHAHWLQYGTC